MNNESIKYVNIQIIVRLINLKEVNDWILLIPCFM